jgi:6-pyruvoyltetrahydropterin/6-carboxytetrahydropterin synthase
VEVTIRNSLDPSTELRTGPARDGPIGDDSFSIADFEKIVDDELIKVVDHKNLNYDVIEFSKVNPTVENIAAFAWRQLVGKFGHAVLHRVTVWENDRTCCSYCG